MSQRCEECDSGQERQIDVGESTMAALLAGAFTGYMLLRGPDTMGWLVPGWIILLVTVASAFVAGGAGVLAVRLYVHQRRHHR